MHFSHKVKYYEPKKYLYTKEVCYIGRFAMSLLFIDGVQSQTASFMFIGKIIKQTNVISIAGLVYTAFAPLNRKYWAWHKVLFNSLYELKAPQYSTERLCYNASASDATPAIFLTP